MNKTVIKVENLSKQYRLGEMGTGTISHDLNRWWHQIRGKEDPYLKIGEVNDRATKGSSEYVWALRDINFEVKQGEVLGIIGKNGAGKSTLLKLLSRVTSPTTGAIKAKGRIASLLEVGTGFHPELTGRENIFLNGAILGMTKAEIKSKLDEIIAFSGTERYIDTPVKRYSSGMTVRLAFAVAAHLEPEILIVDEVLAVGDAEFQKKAIGKMQDVSKGGGRTVLFVSHNMAAVKSLCGKCIMLKNGTISKYGDTESIIHSYLNDNSEKLLNVGFVEALEKESDKIEFCRIELKDKESEIKAQFELSEEIHISIRFRLNSKINRLRIGIQLLTEEEVVGFVSAFSAEKADVGDYELTAVIPERLLNEGVYYLKIGASVPNIEQLIEARTYLSFTTLDLEKTNQNLNERWSGIFKPQLKWSLVENG